jgi:predicted MFS family arabinose efflux permease
VGTRRTKIVCSVLTAVSTLATSYYLNYLFFFLRDDLGFGNRGNLAVTALHGSLYAVSAWQAGKFAHRRGFRASLTVGFSILTLALAAGGLLSGVAGQVAVLMAYSLSLPFIWPAIEALVTHGEAPSRVPHAVGVFNCTWSGFGALAYFTGGALYDWLGRGAVFWLPAALFGAQLLAVVMWLPREPPRDAIVPVPAPPRAVRPMAATFLQLARIANPFAYVAIYTLLAVMPGLGTRFGLSPARVGLFCSVWMFGRLASFVLLWHWPGWHYRFSWLLWGYAVLAVSFLAVVTGPTLWLVVSAQLGFGLAAGLVYYSSLFYSMDVGEAPAEHSGLHEAAIGAGICAGPGVGALALLVFPEMAHAGVFAVGGLLLGGLLALGSISMRARSRGHA